jgi:hypothetical protein
MNETVSIIIWIILKGEAAGYHRKIGHEVGAESTNKAPHAISRRTGTEVTELNKPNICKASSKAMSDELAECQACRRFSEWIFPGPASPPMNKSRMPCNTGSVYLNASIEIRVSFRSTDGE